MVCAAQIKTLLKLTSGEAEEHLGFFIVVTLASLLPFFMNSNRLFKYLVRDTFLLCPLLSF